MRVRGYGCLCLQALVTIVCVSEIVSGRIIPTFESGDEDSVIVEAASPEDKDKLTGLSLSSVHRNQRNHNLGAGSLPNNPHLRQQAENTNTDSGMASTAKLAAPRAYSADGYVNSILNYMKCLTPTNSQGFCSTFRGCVPNFFTPDGELEAPALAELITFSMGYCNDPFTSEIRRQRSHSTVGDRIICCPGQPRHLILKKTKAETGEEPINSTETSSTISAQILEQKPINEVHETEESNINTDTLIQSAETLATNSPAVDSTESPSQLQDDIIYGLHNKFSMQLLTVQKESESNKEALPDKYTATEASSVIKISPEPVAGTNGKFTVGNNGVQIETLSTQQPPLQTFSETLSQSNVVVSPTNVKTEATLDSNPVMILNGETLGKPEIIEGPVYNKAPKFSSKITAAFDEFSKSTQLNLAENENDESLFRDQSTQISEIAPTTIKYNLEDPEVLSLSDIKRDGIVDEETTLGTEEGQTTSGVLILVKGKWLPISVVQTADEPLTTMPTAADAIEHDDNIMAESNSEPSTDNKSSENKSQKNISPDTTIQPSEAEITTLSQRLVNENLQASTYFSDDDSHEDIPLKTTQQSNLKSGVTQGASVSQQNIKLSEQDTQILKESDSLDKLVPSKKKHQNQYNSLIKIGNSEENNEALKHLTSYEKAHTATSEEFSSEFEPSGHAISKLFAPHHVSNKPVVGVAVYKKLKPITKVLASKFHTHEDDSLEGYNYASPYSLHRYPVGHLFKQEKIGNDDDLEDDSNSDIENNEDKDNGVFQQKVYEHDKLQEGQEKPDSEDFENEQLISSTTSANDVQHSTVTVTSATSVETSQSSSSTARYPESASSVAGNSSSTTSTTEASEFEPEISSSPDNASKSTSRVTEEPETILSTTQAIANSSQEDSPNGIPSNDSYTSTTEKLMEDPPSTSTIEQSSEASPPETTAHAPEGLTPTSQPADDSLNSTMQQLPSDVPVETTTVLSQQPDDIQSENSTEHESEYQILSACKTQDFYRGLGEPSYKHYPWLATVVGGSRPFCSGSLIDERHILTASHFLSNITVSDVFHMRVHIGYRATEDEVTVGPFAVRKVLKVIRHKGFSFEKLYNDIAILVLDRPVRFSEDIHPVCLASGKTNYEDGNTVAVETGWIEDPKAKIISELHPFVDPQTQKYFSFGYKNVTWSLREANNRVRTNSECSANYGFLEKGGITITDTMVCAGSPEGSACGFRGNSGAPLFVPQDGKVEQIGIVSWGIGCGHFPAVFTKVSAFIPWIERVVKSNS